MSNRLSSFDEPSADDLVAAADELRLAGFNLDDARRALRHHGAPAAVLPLLTTFGTLQRADICMLLRLNKSAVTELVQPQLKSETILEVAETKEERGQRRGPTAFWLHLATDTLPPPERRREIRELITAATLVLWQQSDEVLDAQPASPQNSSAVEKADFALEGCLAAEPVICDASPTSPPITEQLTLWGWQAEPKPAPIASASSTEIAATITSLAKPVHRASSSVSTAPPVGPMSSGRKRMQEMPAWSPEWQIAAYIEMHHWHNLRREAVLVFWSTALVGSAIVLLCMIVDRWLVRLALYELTVMLMLIGYLYIDAGDRAAAAGQRCGKEVPK